jgi:carbamoylphosphate synthase small subunit
MVLLSPQAVLSLLYVLSMCAVLCCALQIVAYDFGIKHNILRRLASYGCSITVVPADYPADKVMALNPDGVFFSNGPVSGTAAVV